MNFKPSEKEIEYVKSALKSFNDFKVGDDGHLPVHIVEYDAKGDIIAGIIAAIPIYQYSLKTLLKLRFSPIESASSRASRESEGERSVAFSFFIEILSFVGLRIYTMTFLMDFSSLIRSRVISLPHPVHTMRTSLPTRSTLKSFSPQGWGFLSSRTLPTLNLMICIRLPTL